MVKRESPDRVIYDGLQFYLAARGYHMAKAKMIPRKMLSSDERVVFEARPSAWLHMKAAVVGILIFLVSIVVFFWDMVSGLPPIPYLSDAMANDTYGTYVHWAFAAIAGIALLYVMGKYLKWSSTIYAATDERIIKQKGILNKTYEDIPITMITNIDLAQSLGKRALGYGTIIFSTQGLGGRKADMIWQAVPDPMTVRRKIQEVMDVRVKGQK